jgi:hypothetical protein
MRWNCSVMYLVLFKSLFDMKYIFRLRQTSKGALIDCYDITMSTETDIPLCNIRY